jgi:hypothetical protein
MPANWKPERLLDGPNFRGPQLSRWMLTVCGAWLVTLGFYFAFLRPALLPEDLRFMASSLQTLREAVPGLEEWLRKVLTVLGGFMTSVGVLVVFVAQEVLPLRLKGASWVIALSGVLSVVLMSGTNFALHSDFQWLLLIPAVLWSIALLFYVRGR